MQNIIKEHGVRFLAFAAIGSLALTGCTNTGNSNADSGSGGENEQIVADSAGEGPTCTLEEYGMESFDLTNAKVGFSQSEPEAAAFRAAETQSIKDEAAEVGITDLVTTNANAQLPKQISDIQDMLSQGVDFLIVAPVNSDGLDPALAAAREKGVPVLTIDRKLNNEPCKDYVSFIGSDFVEQGKRAADALAESTDGKANVAILLGASGNNVTEDRTKGFVDQVKAEHPGINIVAKQTGNFARDEGQQVAAQLLQSNPEIDAIYAENDEMGLGAMTAVQSAGLEPGKDVKIVSIDGTRNAVQAIVDGKYNAVIESNPRFGPLAFETAQKFLEGEPVGQDIIIKDKKYDSTNAAESVDGAF